MPAVGAVVDAAIGWLVQSILGNLFTEKLEAWTRRVGLANDVEKLKSAVRYVQMVVAAAKGRKIENEPLARSLSDLRELLYDAEDVMDDLDYYRLKEQVESGNTGDGAATGAHNATNSSTWSVKQLAGTFSGILGKRKREDDTSEISVMIKHIADKAWVLKCQDQEGSTHTLLPRSLEVLRIKALQDETVPYLMARLPSLTQLEVCDSPNLTSLPLGSLTALKRVLINSCDSLASLEGLFSELEISDSPNLTSLQLGFLRALKKLDVLFCKSLASLEGLQSLGSLTDLTILGCYSITPCLNFMSQQAVGFNLFPRLERIKMDDFSALTTSFCKHLTSVQHLVLLENSNSNIKRACLTDEQEKALQLLTSLRKLRFIHCKNLVHLPAVLHSLPSLKKLFVQDCPCIARLPEKGLPPSLEKLKIIDCSAELNEKCRMLAKMIKVKIDRGYVN